MRTEHNVSLALYFFNQLSQYPRQSKREGQVRDFVCRWAASHGFTVAVDRCGNCIIRIPAARGRQRSPMLALQAHFDMVAEKNVGHVHDFSRDPIVPRYEGDWVFAPNTTLGADNGIGIALAMALVEDPLVAHPQLELVFTTDEETGLTGAAGLDAHAIASHYLLNLDSEDDASLITGCAGGLNISFNKKYECAAAHTVALHDSAKVYRFVLHGFHGGHSGVDINAGVGNAICCGARMLYAAASSVSDGFFVGALHGGTVHNAIPREFTAEVLCANNAVRTRVMQIMRNELRAYASDNSLSYKKLHFELTAMTGGGTKGGSAMGAEAVHSARAAGSTHAGMTADTSAPADRSTATDAGVTTNRSAAADGTSATSTTAGTSATTDGTSATSATADRSAPADGTSASTTADTSAAADAGVTTNGSATTGGTGAMASRNEHRYDSGSGRDICDALCG